MKNIEEMTDQEFYEAVRKAKEVKRAKNKQKQALGNGGPQRQ